MEYVRQICYQGSGNLPIYFYLHEAQKSREEAVVFLDSIPINSQAKEILKRRISEEEIKFSKLIVTNTVVSEKKQKFYHAIIEDDVIVPSSNNDLKYFLLAVRGLKREEIAKHKECLLNALYDIYTKYFNLQEFSSIKQEFRYALCWVDEALYME